MGGISKAINADCAEDTEAAALGEEVLLAKRKQWKVVFDNQLIIGVYKSLKAGKFSTSWKISPLIAEIHSLSSVFEGFSFNVIIGGGKESANWSAQGDKKRMCLGD